MAGSKVHGKLVEARNKTGPLARELYRSRPSNWTRNSALHLEQAADPMEYMDQFYSLPFGSLVLSMTPPFSQDRFSLVNKNDGGSIEKSHLKQGPD